MAKELSLLDLYCGCGGMSTGLCLGAQVGGVNLIARWAIDSDEAACKSFQLNHPETRTRNETTEDFLELLKEWEKLCRTYAHSDSDVSKQSSNETSKEYSTVPPAEFEVSKIVDICFGDPNNVQKRNLYFKVCWKGCGPSDDTWVPVEALNNYKEAIRRFVIDGKNQNILPLHGTVDVICGGPPCQDISGSNRKRKLMDPFGSERNRQIIVFMDVIQFLKPRYIYMENVLDILKFSDATLARYALRRLSDIHYQAKLGIMAAACYGLPQIRMRVILLGCHPNEKLPPFPLPTHDHEAIWKNCCPKDFKHNFVRWPASMPMRVEKPIVLEDILSDLPEVTNGERRDEMQYTKGPQTEFQRYIRTCGSDFESRLYDHRPKKLNKNNYIRVSLIPKEKGADFRKLPGVIVGPDNVARLDPTKERELLPSGRPVVPNNTLSNKEANSQRPYGRLWWDEVVGTMLTSLNPHTQPVIHPVQDRLLTVRETARLQGFPDNFRFHGTVRDRYRQIGNAVAIPVGRALGYALAMAYLNKTGDDPLMVLPPKFAFSHDV